MNIDWKEHQLVVAGLQKQLDLTYKRAIENRQRAEAAEHRNEVMAVNCKQVLDWNATERATTIENLRASYQADIAAREAEAESLDNQLNWYKTQHGAILAVLSGGQTAIQPEQQGAALALALETMGKLSRRQKRAKR